MQQVHLEPFQIFLNELEQFSFQERFIKWESFLLYNTQSPKYIEYLEKFIESYPFNYKYWIKLAGEELKKGKPHCLKIYQIGLTKNPKSLYLWKAYLDWLKKQLTNSDPQFLKKELERGFTTIGLHPKSRFLHHYLIELENDLIKGYQLRKRSLKLPLESATEFMAVCKQWLSSLNTEQVRILAKSDKIIEPEQSKIREIILNSFIKSSDTSIEEYNKRQEFETKLDGEQYRPYCQSAQIWRSYLSFAKSFNRFDEVQLIYERALITQCDNAHLWQQYFLYLEHDVGNTPRVLDIFRNHGTFFRNLSIQLAYYWAELEERESPLKARELLIEFEKRDPKLETFVRHIQLEIRTKQFTNAKTLYDTLLTVFSSNPQIISYIAIEYAEFALRYFRDLEFSKKLLKNYFEAYAYNQYLFVNYLEFFIKNVDLKEGNREVFEEFMSLILVGLEKAKKCLDDKQYAKISKIAKNLMRSYLITIYLIKTAERKIKQMQLLIENAELVEIKRNSEFHLDNIDSLSKRKKQNSAIVVPL